MQRRSLLAQAVGLAVCFAVVFATAALGALASVDAASFYAQLARPAWAPPASAFGPVWSVLFVLMGVAVWLVWRERSTSGRRAALVLFAAQLCANALWSWLFFGWRQGAFAFAEVLVLLSLIVATTVVFWRIRRLAAVLMFPYIAWVCLATALTWAVWRANPQLL
jgi:benzodiazapine receptor